MHRENIAYMQAVHVQRTRNGRLDQAELARNPSTKYKSPLQRDGKIGNVVTDWSLYWHTPSEESNMQGRHSALHIALDDSTRAHYKDGCGNRRRLWPWPNGRGLFYCWPTARRLPPPHDTWSFVNGMSANGRCALSRGASTGYTTKNVPAGGRFFPPAVALYVVKLACERPDVVGRSLSQWDSAELARQLVHDGIVEAISPQTVQRILAHHKLKPWRHHLWLSPQVPRDAAFAAQVQEIVTLYTRPLGGWERVLCVDEQTSLQPRTRKAPTLAAQPGQPVRVEHEYARKGALNLFAGFDTRTGTVYATTAERKRQGEFIAFLEHVDREMAPHITTIHVVLDNVRMHKGKQVQAWLAKHPRFVWHFPPVHGSWMNQVEQWFSIL
jgi:hypothetical protein